MQIKLTDGAKLFFEVYGSKLQISQTDVKEKPTLIFLHGGPGIIDHTLYVSFWSRFADIAQVIFIDQRGNGRSDRATPETWNLDQWGDDVYEFCKVLQIEKPIVAGVSWGGHVLCSYSTRHPEQPGGLIFCDTEAQFNIERILNGFEKAGGKKIRAIAQAYLKNPTEENIASYMKECMPYYAKNPYKPEELGRAITNHAVDQYYGKDELHRFNYVNDLQKIQCPSLILAGKDAPLHVPESLQEIAAAIPSQFSNFHLIKNAGSPVYRDAEDEVFNIIKNFLLKI
jgi:proline iminopeptidase